MRIVGVGQVFNFVTGVMEDQIQVVSPDGTSFSVPTTNEGAQRLVKMAMKNGNGEHHEPIPDVTVPAAHVAQQEAPVPIGRIGEEDDEFPEGADVFGGGEPDGLGDEPEAKLFQRTQETSQQAQAAAQAAKNRLGVAKNPADRSGVPSYGISRVDDKGNPVLPAAPDFSMDDDEEEDPGEQF